MTHIRTFLAACLVSGCLCAEAGTGVARAQEGVATGQAASQDIWGVDHEALQRLVRMGGTHIAAGMQGPLKVGDQIPEDDPVQDVPMDVLDRLAPATSPYSGLHLQFFPARDQIILLLPMSRRVVKVYDVRQPEEATARREQIEGRPVNRGVSKDAASAPVAAATAADPRQARPASPEPVPEATTAAPRPSLAPPAKGPAPDEIVNLMTRAEESRRRGDIMVMRLFLERAASLGSQEARFRLGETYDERLLNSWGARGVRPDPARAASLYRESGLDHARAEPANTAQKRP